MAMGRLVVGATSLVLASLVAVASAQTVPHGRFASKSDVFSTPPATVVQTLSPDNSALSMIAEGLELGSERASRDSLVLRVTVPIAATQDAQIKIAARGEAFAADGAVCRTFLVSDGGTSRFQPMSGDALLLESQFEVKSTAKALAFSVVVICDAAKGVFLYSVDSIDMAWSYTEARPAK